MPVHLDGKEKEESKVGAGLRWIYSAWMTQPLQQADAGSVLLLPANTRRQSEDDPMKSVTEVIS